MSDPGSRVAPDELAADRAGLCGNHWADDAQTLVDLARYDWLYARPTKRLHCPVDATPDVDLWALTDVTFACGWQVAEANIPGLGGRLGMLRCSRCCDRAGFPRGKGSPKNDDECRRILGLPPSESEVEA